MITGDQGKNGLSQHEEAARCHAKSRFRESQSPVYTHLAIRLDRYDIDAGVSVSYLLERPDLAFHDADDDPVFEHVTRLLAGSARYPSERVGERVELTIRGDDGPSTGSA